MKEYKGLLKTNGLLWGQCTIWTIYNTLHTFYFVYDCKLFVHIICNHK